MTRPTDAALRHYLLGTLAEEEALAVEAAALADDEVLARLEALDDDVVDDLVGGRLAAAERARVAARLGAGAAGRARLAFAGALRTVLAREPPRAAAQPLRGPWQRAAGRWLALAAVGLLATLAAYVILRDAGSAPPARVVYLVAAAARGTAPPPLQIPDTAREVELQLDLEGEPPFDAYRVAIRTRRGGEVWRRDRLPAAAGAIEDALSVVVPAHLLPPAGYVLTLWGLGEAAETTEIGRFDFQVTAAAP